MKKILALLLAALMILSFTACKATEENNDNSVVDNESNEAENNDNTENDTANDTADTVGAALLADFKADPAGTAQEIADRLLTNPVIQFMGGSMPVEEGFLTGFNEAEIKGFKEGVMFSPMIGTIPFVGYIFILEDGADVESFKTTLKDNANLRWNICTEAEELIVENEGNTVFFLMCPKSLETNETPDDMGIAAEDGIVLE